MIKTIIEIVVVAIVIVMLFNEEKIARWEERVFCRFKRKSLKLIKGYSTASETCASVDEEARLNA